MSIYNYTHMHVIYIYIYIYIYMYVYRTAEIVHALGPATLVARNRMVVLGGSHLSSATCLTQVFFKRGE